MEEEVRKSRETYFGTVTCDEDPVRDIYIIQSSLRYYLFAVIDLCLRASPCLTASALGIL